MYKRKIETVLKAWIEDPSHKPLVVKGVRQCGKTSSVLAFARSRFKHVVYLEYQRDNACRSETFVTNFS